MKRWEAEVGRWLPASWISARKIEIMTDYDKLLRPFANLPTFQKLLLLANVFRIMIYKRLKCDPYVSWELYVLNQC